MKYNDLQVAANKRTNRVGRGISAGQGKTAGRGTKGQNSRTGGGVRPGFEGGQMPLAMRMPKLRGFRSTHLNTQEVYTKDLQRVKGTVIDNFTLAEAGLIQSAYYPAKLLLKGNVDKAYNIKIQAASSGAVVALQKAGGSFEKTPRPKHLGKDN